MLVPTCELLTVAVMNALDTSVPALNEGICRIQLPGHICQCMVPGLGQLMITCTVAMLLP